MTNEAPTAQDKDRELSWRLIYEEASKARDQKFSNIGLVNEKFNWILVSDLVLLSSVFSLLDSNKSIFLYLAIISGILSIIYCLKGMRIQGYAAGPTRGQMVAELEKGKEHSLMLQEISKKIIDDIASIEFTVGKLKKHLSLSGYLLLAGVIFILISFFPCLQIHSKWIRSPYLSSPRIHRSQIHIPNQPFISSVNRQD